MKKRIIVWALCLLMLYVPAQADSLNRAWRQAALYVPGAALPEDVREVQGGLHFTFLDENKSLVYEVVIDKETNAFLRRSMVALNKEPGKRADLNPADLKKRLAEEAPENELISMFVLAEAGQFSYLMVTKSPWARGWCAAGITRRTAACITRSKRP